MNRTTNLRLALALGCCLLLTACGGGSGGGGGPVLKGQIQILNNTPTYFDRIDVGEAGDPAPKVDRLQGVLLSGSSFTIDVDAGVYDVDVWVFTNPFSIRQPHTGVVVTPGAITTLVVVPQA